MDIKYFQLTELMSKMEYDLSWKCGSEILNHCNSLTFTRIKQITLAFFLRIPSRMFFSVTKFISKSLLIEILLQAFEHFSVLGKTANTSEIFFSPCDAFHSISATLCEKAFQHTLLRSNLVHVYNCRFTGRKTIKYIAFYQETIFCPALVLCHTL